MSNFVFNGVDISPSCPYKPLSSEGISRPATKSPKGNASDAYQHIDAVINPVNFRADQYQQTLFKKPPGHWVVAPNRAALPPIPRAPIAPPFLPNPWNPSLRPIPISPLAAPYIKTQTGEEYIIGSCVGKGVYGKVLKATSGGKACAIKFFEDHDGGFEESCNLATIRGAPHIIHKLRAFSITKVKKGGIDPKFKYAIAMPFLSASKPLPLSTYETITFAKQALEALAFVHAKGIIHCDLKLKNTGFNDLREFYLFDFGLSQHINSIAKKQLVQSRWERAPEIFKQMKYKARQDVLDDLDLKYDTKIDIWSLGCILYELSTGRPLFPSDIDDGERNCPKAHLKLVSEKMKVEPNGLAVWKNEIIAAKGSLHFAQLIIDLIEPMIKENPEERISAAEALEKLVPLKRDVHFKIGAPSDQPMTLRLFSAAEYDSGSREPRFEQDLSKPELSGKCLHLRRAKKDEYVFELVDSSGKQIGTGRLPIQGGDTLYCNYEKGWIGSRSGLLEGRI